jgi:hypothetical protein
MFLVVLVGVVLVAGGLQVAIAMKFSWQTDESVAKRLSLNEELKKLAQSKVNAEVVAAAQGRLKAAQEGVQTLADDFVKLSRSNYPILSADVGGKTLDAYPVGADDRTRSILLLKVPDIYDKQVQQLVARLDATDQPTEEEIREEAARLAAISGTATSGPADLGTSLLTGRYPGAAGDDRALRNTVWACSRKGQIYANQQSMYAVPRTGDKYSEDELWMAHLALWVQRDIVEAIRQANQEALRELPATEESGVAVSAVKRLVRVNLLGYAMSGGAEAGPGGPAGPAAGAAAGMRMSYVALAGGGGRYDSNPSIEARLTGRTCNPLYDVVHYEFTVVMSTRQLRTLIEKLYDQNLHTVLNQTIMPVGASVVSGGGPGGMPGGSAMAIAANPASAAERYYYGTEPVMEITLTCELLMAAEWTRGRFDPKTQKWDEPVKDGQHYPPLMPPKMLGMLRDRDPKALRDADLKRALATSAGPGPGGPPMGPLPSKKVNPAVNNK